MSTQTLFILQIQQVKPFSLSTNFHQLLSTSSTFCWDNSWYGKFDNADTISMGWFSMALTEVKVRNAKPAEKPIKLTPAYDLSGAVTTPKSTVSERRTRVARLK